MGASKRLRNCETAKVRHCDMRIESDESAIQPHQHAGSRACLPTIPAAPCVSMPWRCSTLKQKTQKRAYLRRRSTLIVVTSNGSRRSQKENETGPSQAGERLGCRPSDPQLASSPAPLPKRRDVGAVRRSGSSRPGTPCCMSRRLAQHRLAVETQPGGESSSSAGMSRANPSHGPTRSVAL